MTPYRTPAARPEALPWRVTRWQKWKVKVMRYSSKYLDLHTVIALGLPYTHLIFPLAHVIYLLLGSFLLWAIPASFNVEYYHIKSLQHRARVRRKYAAIDEEQTLSSYWKGLV